MLFRKLEKRGFESELEGVLDLAADVIEALDRIRLGISLANMSVLGPNWKDVAERVFAACQELAVVRHKISERKLEKLDPIQLRWLSARGWDGISRTVRKQARLIVQELKRLEGQVPLEEAYLAFTVEEMARQLRELDLAWPSWP